MSFLNRLFGRNRSKPSPRQLLNALQAFITADTWAGSRRVVEEHPELLTDEADALLGQLIEGARAQGDENATRLFEEHRALLRRCREAGVEAAFTEKTGAVGAQRAAPLPDDLPPEARAAMEALAALSPDLRDALGGLLGQVSSPDELQAALAQRPELRAALEEALAGLVGGTGPGVPPEFRADLQRAQEAEARYRRTGDRQALDDAAAAWQRIWNHPSFPAAPPNFRLAALNDGAGVFWRRYRARGGIDDLSIALRCWEQAVAQTPEGSPDLPMYLNNLGNGLSARYARTGELADLAAAIRAYEQAVAQTSEGSPYLPMYLNNLGTGLSNRYARTGDLADLAAAIRAYEQAVAQTPEGSPELPRHLNNLGTGLSDRYARTGELADLAAAIRAYETACQQGTEIALEVALGAARNWGNWATEREEWPEAVQAYDYGLKASQQLFEGQLLRASKEAWLREVRGLHARAAYASARTGDLARAVEALEGGRARLLGQVLERERSDLAQLATLAPALYQSYAAAVGQLQVLEAQEISGQVALPAGQTLTEAIRRARAGLRAAVKAIRGLPGYEEFLTVLSFAQVQAAAEPGCPLVYLAATPAGALALVVPSPQTSEVSETSEVWPVWSDLTQDDLNDLLVQQDGQTVTGYLPAQFAGGAYMHVALKEILPLLGARLMSPLAETLRQLGATGAVLIPGGLLSLLPLGAATLSSSPHGGEAGRGVSFLDEFDVTYAPSALALAHSRRALAGLDFDPQGATLLAVGDPPHTGAPRLPYAAAEVEDMAPYFPPDGRRLLYEEQATREATLAGVPGAHVLHFACHGTFDLADALDSALLLAGDDRLTLRDILGQLSLAGSRLAVLSACQTAITDFQNLPDEVIGLPAGFLSAGVPGVVGSLWRVSDVSTALLMERFYYFYRQERRPPAAALRAAQRWLRDVTNEELGQVFQARQETGPDRPRMSYYALGRRTTGNAQAKPFSSPRFWAAFTFHGV